MVATAIAAIFLLAPTEETMGAAQRIVYIHVSVAWMGLAAFVLMAVTGGMYFFAAPGLGPLVAGRPGNRLALLQPDAGHRLAVGPCPLEHLVDLGPAADDRFCPVGHVFRGPGAPQRRGRPAPPGEAGAIMAIVRLLDVPLVIMATRWFRGIHPKSPHMEPTMHLVLLTSVVCFTVFFTMLLLLRRSQLHVAEVLDELEETACSLS